MQIFIELPSETSVIREPGHDQPVRCAGDPELLAGECPSLLEYLAWIPDPRDPRGIRHTLTSLLPPTPRPRPTADQPGPSGHTTGGCMVPSSSAIHCPAPGPRVGRVGDVWGQLSNPEHGEHAHQLGGRVDVEGG